MEQNRIELILTHKNPELSDIEVKQIAAEVVNKVNIKNILKRSKLSQQDIFTVIEVLLMIDADINDESIAIEGNAMLMSPLSDIIRHPLSLSEIYNYFQQQSNRPTGAEILSILLTIKQRPFNHAKSI